MEDFKNELFSKGGTLSDWVGLITNGLQAEDQLWVESKKMAGEHDGVCPEGYEQGRHYGV